MERLTKRIEAAPEHPNGYIDIKDDRILEAIDLLADYEDLGYTPDELRELMIDKEHLLDLLSSGNYEDYKKYTVDEVEGLVEDSIEERDILNSECRRLKTESEQLKAENKRLKADCESMREMIMEYCAKVEDGKIRDNGLYCKYVETLNTLQEG